MNAKILYIIAFLAIFFMSCTDNVLDREQLDKQNDDNFWTTEMKVRLYANEYYDRFFRGYGYRGEITGAALLDYTLNDDIVNYGAQPNFELQIPASRGNNSATYYQDTDKTWKVNFSWINTYTGNNWIFAWVRKSNHMLTSINNKMGGVLNEESFNHWTGMARFFRGMEYAGLVTVFGDVPYFDKVPAENDFAELYKPRTPRNEVMDKVYDDWVFAMNNVRLDDGDLYVNRYVVAAYVCRLALVEGTWQKYHYNDNQRATKFFQLAVQAGDLVRNSGKYGIFLDFRSLFGSKDLKGQKDCILYRNYEVGKGITHSIATNCNLKESRVYNANLDFIKSFICNDGNIWEKSSLADAKDFDLEKMFKTRDPRLEATIWEKPTIQAKGSLLYICKFIDREGPTYFANGGAPPAQYLSINNDNDYPVMRYAELLLNWIEAKAELATIGGTAVSQNDIDVSINQIRNRPLDKPAIDKGVQKTKPMLLTSLPDDSKRGDVSQLIWEIRRERRMEMAFEYSRLGDLRRWKQLERMDTSANPDLLRGAWVNFPTQLPSELNDAANKGKLTVTDMAGNTVVYDGTNRSKMVGFAGYKVNMGRQPFLNVPGINPYLAPIGINQQADYTNRGYVLKQTTGWGL